MTDNHPITPPPELVQQWFATVCGTSVYRWKNVVTEAARWGADQELEACCEWIGSEGLAGYTSRELRAARRPKPLSLKELNLKHLEVMERDGHYLPEIISDLRRAIESLPE